MPTVHTLVPRHWWAMLVPPWIWPGGWVYLCMLPRCEARSSYGCSAWWCGWEFQFCSAAHRDEWRARLGDGRYDPVRRGAVYCWEPME
jgi:hypothetical protein